jgi:hypothetical protein
VKTPMDFRHIDAIAGDLRPANPNAEKPTGGFWPILRPDDLRSWRIGDPERIDMSRKGVFLPAGPSGNLLLTRRADYKKCQLSITLSATRGTEAFLALRAHRGPDGWRGITAPVFDEGGRIHAGRQSVDFRLPDRRRAIEATDPERPLRILFRIDDQGASRLEIRKEKSSMDHAPTPAGQYVGAVGVFVKSGTLIIHAMDVHD